MEEGAKERSTQERTRRKGKEESYNGGSYVRGKREAWLRHSMTGVGRGMWRRVGSRKRGDTEEEERAGSSHDAGGRRRGDESTVCGLCNKTAEGTTSDSPMLTLEFAPAQSRVRCSRPQRSGTP